MRLRVAASLVAAVATLSPTLAQQGTTFKSNVNMLAVDALVVDRDGTPILGLLPDDFTVAVNSKARRVVSATLVRYHIRRAAQRPGLDHSAASARPHGHVIRVDDVRRAQADAFAGP